MELEMPKCDEMDSMCAFCTMNIMKYVCPRCSQPYCSLICYKSAVHLDCSEAFYKENIQEYLRGEGKNNDDARKNMEEILQRVRGQDNDLIWDSDSDDVEDITERLSGVDLDNAEEIWCRLTDEEKAEFKELVRSGKAGELMPEWEPWWTSTHSLPKVRFLDDNSDPYYVSLCPSLRFVSPLSNLTQVHPSPLVFFNLTNVIGSYALVARYYNGQYSHLYFEVSTIFVNLSKNLLSNETFESFELALESVAQNTLNCSHFQPHVVDLSVMKSDAIKILKGPNQENCGFYCQSALSDAIQFLSNARKSPKSDPPAGPFSKAFPLHEGDMVTKQQLGLAVKKLEYYLSWIQDYHRSALSEHLL